MTTAKAPTYAKTQFAASKQFTALEKDVLSVILDEDKEYTLDQAKKRISDYAKRKVT